MVALFRQLAAEDPSIPEEILAAWQNAVQSKSKNAKSALFNAFLKAGKNWGQLLGLRFVHALHVMYSIQTLFVGMSKNLLRFESIKKSIL